MGNILTNIFSAGASKLVEAVGKTADELITSKEEKEQLKLEFLKEVNRAAEAMEAEANKVLEAQLKDMADARKANVDIQVSEKASWWAKNTAYFLDVFLGLVWGFVTILILLKALKLVNVQAEWTVILSLHTAVTTMFMIPINFHRGTSIGSMNKDKAIANFTNQINKQ